MSTSIPEATSGDFAARVHPSASSVYLTLVGELLIKDASTQPLAVPQTSILRRVFIHRTRKYVL